VLEWRISLILCVSGELMVRLWLRFLPYSLGNILFRRTKFFVLFFNILLLKLNSTDFDHDFRSRSRRCLSREGLRVSFHQNDAAPLTTVPKHWFCKRYKRFPPVSCWNAKKCQKTAHMRTCRIVCILQYIYKNVITFKSCALQGVS
jgi:hypothetical protein